MCSVIWPALYSILLCNNVDTSKELRELAAGIIISNPDKFTSVLLGKTNAEYAQWLLRQQSWGGINEVMIQHTCACVTFLPYSRSFTVFSVGNGSG